MYDLVLPVKFKARMVLSKVVPLLKETFLPREASVPGHRF